MQISFLLQSRHLFFTGESSYFSRNQWSEVKLSQWWISFLQIQLFTSPDINWWTRVSWIIVMFLSAVWTLILTAPIHIHCWASDANLHFSKSDEETNSSTSCMPWEWAHFQLIFIFGRTFLLIVKQFRCENSKDYSSIYTFFLWEVIHEHILYSMFI